MSYTSHSTVPSRCAAVPRRRPRAQRWRRRLKILTYHVVSGTALSTDLTEGKIGTVQGEAVDVTLDPIAINGAGVAIPDVLATNGVVHVIDAVLIPPEGL